MSEVAAPPAPAAPAAPAAPPAAAPAPAAAAAPWHSQVWDPATPGSFLPDWHTKAPDPAKYEPYKGAKTFDDLLSMSEKRVSDAQAALRSRPAAGLPPRPGTDATPEAWDFYRQAHGLPLKPEEYGITKPDNIPAELWREEDASGFAGLAHSLDMKPEQVKGVLDWYHGNLATGLESQQQASVKATTERQFLEATKLGQMFGDKVDANLKDLQDVAEGMGHPREIFDPTSDKFWGVNAADLYSRLLARVPRGEDGTQRNMGAPTATGQYDKQWAKDVLKAGHPDHEAFINPKHARHAEIQRLRNEAYALGAGQK